MVDDVEASRRGTMEPAPAVSAGAADKATGKTWTERWNTPPPVGSPFYVAPPSSKTLRWTIVMLLVLPSAFAVVVVVAAVTREWAAVAVAAVLLCLSGVMRTYQLRAILRELAKRRAQALSTEADQEAPNGPESGANRDDDEEKRRRKAAWKRVRHDVFPILSDPDVLKRPFQNRNKWKD
jgi:hypothetical protein